MWVTFCPDGQIIDWLTYGSGHVQILIVNGQDLISTAEYRYDALGRRIQKRSKHHHTGDEHNIIYGWDG
ncbi:TPA: hypothetical protein ACNV0F_003781, partial [Acinetobacter baumannii]